MRVKKMLLCSVMALSLVTLAACGMGDNADDNGNTDGTNVESTTGGKDNGNNTKNNGNGVVDDAADAIEDAGDAIVDGAEDIGNDVENGVEDATGTGLSLIHI